VSELHSASVTDTIPAEEEALLARVRTSLARHARTQTSPGEVEVDDAAKYPEGYGPRIRYGGHEDGPSMHTGDADPTLISATGVIGTIAE
jgi:hypothetical protein